VRAVGRHCNAASFSPLNPPEGGSHTGSETRY
jgi:hypothetical protein